MRDETSRRMWRGAAVATASSSRALALALVVAALVTVSCPASARAYRTFADDLAVGASAHWVGSGSAVEIDWELDARGLGATDLSAADFEGALSQAWGTIESARCGSIVLRTRGSAAGPAARGDGRNTVSVVSSGWAALGLPDQAAFTDVQIEVGSDDRARIVEADVYFNFEFYEFQLEPGGPGLDLVAVALHEGLHAWGGLLHPCEPYGAGGAPDCAALPAATMSAVFPIYGEGGGRTLGEDDQVGLCAVYGDCAPACPMGTYCADGLCEPETCAGAECLACTESCGGAACNAGSTCESGVCGVAGAAAGFCVPLGSTGASCAAASDCGSGLCLTSARVGRYCTHDCAADSECGAAQVCSSVGGRRVCAPPPPSGCSVSWARTPNGLFSWIVLVLISRLRPRRTS